MGERINLYVSIGLVTSLILCILLMGGLYWVSKTIPNEMYMLTGTIAGGLIQFLGNALRQPRDPNANLPVVSSGNVEQVNVGGANEDLQPDRTRESPETGTA